MRFTPKIDEQLASIVRLVDVDREAGLTELAALAETGDKTAILYLGLYLSENSETTAESLKWLLMANEFGSADAAWNIAMIARERGESGEMRKWIDRAADLGEMDAEEVQRNGYNVDLVLRKQ